MICWLFGEDMNSLYACMILGGRSYFSSFKILVFSFSKNILQKRNNRRCIMQAEDWPKENYVIKNLRYSQNYLKRMMLWSETS